MAGTSRSASHVARQGRRLIIGGRRGAPRLLWGLLLGSLLAGSASAATAAAGVRVDIILSPPAGQTPGGGGALPPPAGGGDGGAGPGGGGSNGGGGGVIPGPGGVPPPGGVPGPTPPGVIGGGGLCLSLTAAQLSAVTVSVACNGRQFVSISPSAGHESAASYGDVFRMHLGAGSLFALDDFASARWRLGTGGTLTGVRIDNITEAEKLVEMLVSF
jgi:hypothetical protein